MASASGHPDDDLLQARIDTARFEFLGATGTRDRAVKWLRLKDLLQQRSAREIAAMERAKHLA